MGNDGGSIAKRDELVRTRATYEKVDPELLRQSLWTVCSLSRAPLYPPVASCPLGRLYNKDAVIQHLLARHTSTSNGSSSKPVDPIAYIRGLKDVVELKLTPNSLYKVGESEGGSVYPFMCPLSGKQMDGKQRFIYIPTCGCAMSFTGLRTTVSTSEASSKDKPDHRPCPICGSEFDASGLTGKAKQPEVGSCVVTINPNKEEEEAMREVMEKFRAEQTTAARKKSKARTADEKGDAEKVEKKRRKAEKAEKKAETRAKIATLTAELAAEQ